MNKEQIQSLVRSLLVSVGGSLVAKGVITSDQLSNVVGAIMVILPVIWSVWQKRESAKLDKAVDTVNAAVASGDASHVSKLDGSTTVVTNP